MGDHWCKWGWRGLLALLCVFTLNGRADEIADAQKQIAEQLPILQKLIEKEMPGAVVSVEENRLIIAKQRKIEPEIPSDFQVIPPPRDAMDVNWVSQNGTAKVIPANVMLDGLTLNVKADEQLYINPTLEPFRDWVRKQNSEPPDVGLDGLVFTYNIEGGLDRGATLLPAWPDFYCRNLYNSYQYGTIRTSAANMSSPDEAISMRLNAVWGCSIPVEKLRAIHEIVLREAGSFQTGRTLFKAILLVYHETLRQSGVATPGIKLSGYAYPPPPGYNYILKKDGTGSKPPPSDKNP